MEIEFSQILNIVVVAGVGVLGFLARHTFNSFNSSIKKLDSTLEKLDQSVDELNSRVSHIEGKLEN